MPHPKRPSPHRRKGRGRGQSSGGKRSLEKSFVPFADTSVLAENGLHNFSLQAEAISTYRHQTCGVSDQRLRYSKVNFIRAGDFGPSKLEKSESAMAEMSLNSSPENLVDQRTEPPVTLHLENLGPLHKAQSPDEFVIDMQGTLPLITGLPPPNTRSQSPTTSSSSDEIIVFGGRDATGRGIQRAPGIFRDITNGSDTKINIVEDCIQESMALHAGTAEMESQSARSELKQPSIIRKSLPDVRLGGFASAKRKIKRSVIRRGRQRHTSLAENDGLIADYIAHMEEQCQDHAASFAYRELGGADSDLWQETDTTTEGPTSVPLNTNSWGSAELDDFDEVNTSEEILGPVHALLSKRDTPSGPQYLVVCNGHSVDEARWIPQSRLTDAVALAHITRYEAEENVEAKFFSRGDDENPGSEADLEDHKEKDESDIDEMDLLQRRSDRMTDEKIARLLSKQEELGLGSDALVLFDNSVDQEHDEEFNFRYTLRPTQRRQRSSKMLKGDFSSASALADSYDGFDVMDFDRPSLRKKPKGRKGKLAFDLSDSELEASMQVAWETDRAKKGERRREREELRAQGLLGKKQQKPDLKSKYKEGIGIHAAKDEIKTFLMGTNTTLALPPMNKADRKIVHELANLFHLKSKSMGSGQKRFPVLYRTSRTTPYVESAFSAVEHRLTHRFLPRLDLKGRRGHSPSNLSGRGGFGSAGVSYRDGDVVGASAPELGMENKGRAMLEKMGWSSGTALGALNNKGILEPVSHVVKTTKAGLG